MERDCRVKGAVRGLREKWNECKWVEVGDGGLTVVVEWNG